MLNNLVVEKNKTVKDFDLISYMSKPEFDQNCKDIETLKDRVPAEFLNLTPREIVMQARNAAAVLQSLNQKIPGTEKTKFQDIKDNFRIVAAKKHAENDRQATKESLKESQLKLSRLQERQSNAGVTQTTGAASVRAEAAKTKANAQAQAAATERIVAGVIPSTPPAAGSTTTNNVDNSDRRVQVTNNTRVEAHEPKAYRPNDRTSSF